MKILGIEHIAIATEEGSEVQKLFSSLLGLEDHSSEEITDQQVITDIFNTGAGKVELLRPTSSGSPVSKFLAKRGPGLHHLALEVDDLPAWLIYLKSQGIELIDEKPRLGAEGNQIAFLHPRSTSGVLIELCQKP